MIFALIAGCEPFEPATSDSGTTAPSGPLREVRAEDKADNDGVAIVTVDVLDGETAFQVTATSTGSHTIGFEFLRDPRGDDVLTFSQLAFSDRQISGAYFASRQSAAFNWPVRREDGPLRDGKWKVGFTIYDENFRPDGGAKASFVNAFKSDDDLSEAEVRVRILWTRGLDDQPKVVNAVADAVEEWRDIWAAEGITLVERYESSDLPPNLSFYSTGSAEAEAASAGKDVGELQLVIGEEVDGDPFIYGVSAGIPGTVQITQSTYVVLSWLAHAGRDAKFEEGEIELMGQTMAHEIGHYLGLFHPVEVGYYRYDALDDTDECQSYGSCESALGTNLMYPYSLCDFSGQNCVSQVRITNDQAGVLHQSVGAL